MAFAVTAAVAVGAAAGAAFAADPAPAPAAQPAAQPAQPAAQQPAAQAAPAAQPAAPVSANANPASDVTAPAPTVTVDNPYGLDALWAQGDIVARGTLVILVIMSMSTWYILILKLVEQTRLLIRAKAANKTFWKSKTPSDGLKTLQADSPFYFVAASGLEAVEHHEGSLTDNIDLNTWVTMSVQRAVEQIVSRLQGGLAVLATVGSTAPFVGLFGTVWGIYHALTAIGIAGQASIDKVAGPVGEALIMTAIGLAVAVPAVLGYNWLVRRNKTCIEAVRNFSGDLHSILISGDAGQHKVNRSGSAAHAG
ncbi:MAG: MotA/TolQ/ExbB proton channel family protein [Telmatospirillum sp.]|nr:MotA/TolQ/ExbB proton channel family protein [Telmatospirillum sp.]